MTQSVFGSMPDGAKVDLFRLQDDEVEAQIMSLGASVVSLRVPDRRGNLADVILGYESAEAYLNDPKSHFGAIVGRYANRIAHGSFRLDGREYSLPRNNGNNSLHGGTKGFDRYLWQAQPISKGVEFTLVSEDGDQGYPGTLTARVRYTLENRALSIEYFATTDQDTVLNLTNHSYFNLAGEGQGDILGHWVQIPADHYLPTDATQIPTGQIASVAGTPFDFRQATAVGARIDQDDEQLHLAKGYDVSYVQNDSQGKLTEAARVVEPVSGRAMVVRTTQPAVHFYSGNSLDGTAHGKKGHVYGRRAGLCLETQHFPDSPNQPAFPTTELKAGETFHSVTVFAFSTES